MGVSLSVLVFALKGEGLDVNHFVSLALESSVFCTVVLLLVDICIMLIVFW